MLRIQEPSRRAVLLAGGGAVGAACLLGLGWWRMDGPGAPARGPALPRALGMIDVTLTDHRGARTPVGDWARSPALVFFGFTWCPDICPTTLGAISAWLDDLGAEADRLGVALVSVDPERDTPEVLADYLSPFDPRIVGYTGSPEEIAALAQAMAVTYAKVPQDQGYTMNHTAGVFLFREGGAFAGIIDPHDDPAFALPRIRRALT